jgi:hypothetical protein
LREQTLAAVVPGIVRGRDLQELPRRVRSFEVVLVLQLVDRRAEHDVLVDRRLLLCDGAGEQCQHDHLLPPHPERDARGNPQLAVRSPLRDEHVVAHVEAERDHAAAVEAHARAEVEDRPAVIVILP